jgi:hypothetical protein
MWRSAWEEGIAGWVTRNRRPLIVNDVRSNAYYTVASPFHDLKRLVIVAAPYREFFRRFRSYL